MKTIDEIVSEMRALADDIEAGRAIVGQTVWRNYADRFEAAWKREADSIECLVRDAIIDYQEMYAHAPNDDVERELIDRAERGNAWLVAHGYEPEPVHFGKGKEDGSK